MLKDGEKRLNKVMYQNLCDNLGDLKASLGRHLSKGHLNYYCYLLALLRLVIDFSDIASAQKNPKLLRSLDDLYQSVQSEVVIRANERLPWIHVTSIATKRIVIGQIAKKVRGIHSIVESQITKRK